MKTLLFFILLAFFASCATISPQTNTTTDSDLAVRKQPKKPFKSDKFRNGNEDYYYEAPFDEKWQVCYIMDEIVDGESAADTSWVNNSIYPMDPLPVFEAAGKMGYQIFLDLGVVGKIEIRNSQDSIIFKESFTNWKLNPVLWDGVLSIVNDVNK